MAELVDIRQWRRDCRPSDANDAAIDKILLDEGLDLLNAYRSISDAGMRLSIKRLVEECAALHAMKAQADR